MNSITSSYPFPPPFPSCSATLDGTISDSFHLGYSSTLKVLEENGIARISHDDYHQGTKFTTPRRLAWHATGNPDSTVGIALGARFDEIYVNLVTKETTPLYAGIYDLLAGLSSRQIKMAALSNACGDYVKAVVKVNELSPFFSLSLRMRE